MRDRLTSTRARERMLMRALRAEDMQAGRVRDHNISEFMKKAAIMQALAVVAKLLLLLGLGTSHSSAQEDTITCGDEMTTDSRICNELFQAFQASIVTDTANLYNLRKLFFPSTTPPSTLLNVSYELTFEDGIQTPCDFDSNDTVNSSDILYAVNSSDILYENLGWTSQSIYTVFHPATLNRFQPQFFYEMMIKLESSHLESALLWEGTDQLLTLNLFLHVKELSCLPSHTQIYETLKDLTSVLKVYARDQKSLTEWESRDSYVLDGRVFDEEWWKHECDIYNVVSCNIRAINLVFSLCLTVAGCVAIVWVLRSIKGPKRGTILSFKELKSECLTCCKRQDGGPQTDQVQLEPTLPESQSDPSKLGESSMPIAVQPVSSESSTQAPVQSKSSTQPPVHPKPLASESPVQPKSSESSDKPATKEDVKYPFYHSLLWSATGVLFWGWLAVYIAECIKIDKWRQYTPDTREVPITIVWLSIMLSVSFSASFFISSRIKIKIDLLHPSHAIWGGICGCRGDIIVRGFYACLCEHSSWLWKCLPCKEGIFKSIHDCLRGNPIAKNVVGALPLFIIFLWIGYIALNAIPVLLYFLLYRTRVICLYTYVVAALTFLIFVITEGDYERKITKNNLKKQNKKVGFKSWIKHHMMYTSIFGVIFLGITTVIFIVTYRTIVAGGSTGNVLYGIFRALIPALLIGAPSGWIGKKLRKHYRLEKEKVKEKETTEVHCTCTCKCSCNKEGDNEVDGAAVTQHANEIGETNV